MKKKNPKNTPFAYFNLQYFNPSCMHLWEICILVTFLFIVLLVFYDIFIIDPSDLLKSRRDIQCIDNTFKLHCLSKIHSLGFCAPCS